MKVVVHAQDLVVDLPPALAHHLLEIGEAHLPGDEDPRKATEDAPENQSRKGKRSRKSR